MKKSNEPIKSSYNPKLILQLFLTFFKIGLFTFGGGYAMLPLIENDCVEKKKWITHDEMMNVTVIAESTPGPIAINCSTYVGYKQAGLLGAMAATLGVVLPSFIIILLISGILDRFLEVKIVANAFKGVKIAVGILIVDAAVKMALKMKKEALPIGILVGSALLMTVVNIFSLRFSSIALLLFCGVLSLVIYFIKNGKKRGGTK